MFVMVDDIREMTVKKSCKYGEHDLFEVLLFLLTKKETTAHACQTGWTPGQRGDRDR